MKPSPKLIAVLSRLLIGVAIAGTLFAAAVVIEDFRGDRAWREVERDLKARGEPIDFQSFQQNPVPDKENFFKDPGVAFLVYERPDTRAKKHELVRKTHLLFFEKGGINLSNKQGFVDLRSHLRREGAISTPDSVSPAADVLDAMQPCSVLLDEVREAAKIRPLAALQMGNGPFEPPAVDMDQAFGLGVALGVRASTEIEIGKTGEAYADMVALDRISDGLAQAPCTLISLLVGDALDGWVSGAIINGCQRDAWSDAQLAEFQAGIDRKRPLVEVKRALQFERAAVIYFVDAEPKAAAQTIKMPYWMFHGWLQQNKAQFCVRLEDDVLAAIDADSERVHVDRLQKKGSGGSSRFNSPYGWMCRNILGNLGPLVGGLATNAERLKLISLSLAFQRYRLAYGHYPKTISDLVPVYLGNLPISILNGQPYRYLYNSEGACKVYSFGNDGHDDNGANDDIVVELPVHP